MRTAASEHKKSLKIRPARKYLDLYKVLLIKFKEAGSKDFRIDFLTGFGPKLEIYIVN